mgnify:CR=1 FL=1
MKLLEAGGDLWNRCYFVLRSEGRSVLMGVHPVMYGFRVRAWFAGRRICAQHWCGGDKQEDVERLYSIAADILSQREEDFACFHGIPGASPIKPFHLDERFVKKIGEMLSPDFLLKKLPDLADIRSRDLETLENEHRNKSEF